jgi:hypothetical protein
MTGTVGCARSNEAKGKERMENEEWRKKGPHSPFSILQIAQAHIYEK